MVRFLCFTQPGVGVVAGAGDRSNESGGNLFSFRGLQMKVNHKIAPFFLLGKRTIMSVQNNLFFTVCRTAAPG